MSKDELTANGRPELTAVAASAVRSVVATVDREVTKRRGRGLSPEERRQAEDQVIKSVVEPLARIERRIADAERRRAILGKRVISPAAAAAYLALDTRVTAAEIAGGFTPRPMSETHPETFAELQKIAGVEVKKNGADGPPKPAWHEGIL